jgi:hypothetical protein
MEPLRLPQVGELVPPRLPEPLSLPAPVLELPRAEVPSYTPMVFPFAGETFSNGVRVNTKGERDDDQDKKPPENAVPPIVVPAPKVQVPQYQIPDKKPVGSDLPQLAEATTITVPGLDIEIPVPRAEIVSAAAITSVVSVTATLTATSLFKRLVSAFKPVIKAVTKQINKLRNKKEITFGRQRLELRRHRRLHKVKKDGSYILPS